MATLPNACAFSVSNTPGTGSGFTIAAVASGPYRIPRAAEDGAEAFVFVREGDTWEICESVYDHATTTWSRGALVDSSGASVARQTFTSACVVSVVGLEASEVNGLRGLSLRRDDGGIAQAVQVDGVDSVLFYSAAPSGDASGDTDTTALNLALSGATDGGTLFLAPGVYYINAELVLNDVDDFTITSTAGAATLRLADNQGAAVPGDMPNILRIDGCNACRVVGVRFDGNFQNQNMANLAMSFADSAQGGSGNRRDPLTIRYVGAGSACSATISGGTLTTTVTGGPGGENLNIDLTAAAYNTIAELVAYIDGLAAYTATIVHTAFGTQLSERLYARTYADIKTAATGVDFTNASNAGTHEIYGNCIYLVDSDECEISGCDMSNAPHMGILVTGDSSRNRIANNTGEMNNWRAIEIWPNAGTNSSHNVIIGNVLKNSYHDSIVCEFQGTSRNSIIGNTVLLYDVAFNDGVHDGIKVYNSNGNIVQGNTLYGCFITVEVAPCDYNVIAGNTVDGQDRHASIVYVTRGVYVKNGTGNVVVGNTLNDPYYDTIRIGATASKTVVSNNILTANDNASRYPIFVESGSTDNIMADNVLVGNTNSYSDLGTRTSLNGLGTNGALDPASAGNWNGNGREGQIVGWMSGGKKRLSIYSGGAWVNFYAEP